MYPSTLLLSRLQWAWVIGWHIMLPTFTVGLASHIAVLEGFLSIGTLFLLPIILMYSGWSYWVFAESCEAISATTAGAHSPCGGYCFSHKWRHHELRKQIGRRGGAGRHRLHRCACLRRRRAAVAKALY